MVFEPTHFYMLKSFFSFGHVYEQVSQIDNCLLYLDAFKLRYLYFIHRRHVLPRTTILITVDATLSKKKASILFG